jgi:uncharacterized protein (TIGR04551 family)
MVRLAGFLSALALVALVPLAARAQGVMPPPGQGPGRTIGEEETKKEGVAEKAPKEKSQLPTLPPLPPYPGQEQKKFELVTLDGYFRFRAYWFDNYNLNQHDTTQGIPFREPLTCRDRPDLVVAGATTNPIKAACGNSIGTANMRVRLEPTVHLSETLAVHMQVDLLDNLVLGSTPDGVTLDGSSPSPSMPTGVLTTNQVPPEAGKNSPWNSIRVKQAWADVKTPLGTLMFGRMPNHWGLGILANSGGYDWIHGTTCTDCDYGDTVDRFMFGTSIPGTPLRGAIAIDWGSSQPTSGQIDAWNGRYSGQPYDMDDADDVRQYTIMVTHIDEPADWALTIREGRTMLNYGAYFVYRGQDYATQNVMLGSQHPELGYKPVHANVYIPDVWARFTTEKLILELEVAAVLGSVDNAALDPKTALMAPQTWDLRQLGGVLKANYLFVNDELDFGVEVGYASGDQWENDPSGIINVHEANYYPPPDAVPPGHSVTASNFRFNFDYKPDLIFFREILGAVTNATYFKPSLRYDVNDRFSAKAQLIASFANVPVATPGNQSMYGIELDGDIGYHNDKEGFFAGLSYGVFFPQAALDHPVLIFGLNAAPTSTAQTFQGRFVLKF